MKISYFDFIPIGKFLIQTLNSVLAVNTDKSKSGKITKQEISDILVAAVPRIVAHLGESVDGDK